MKLEELENKLGATEKAFESLCEEIARREILIDQYEGEIEEKKKAI